jgi:nitrate/nitrite transporter NarK
VLAGVVPVRAAADVAVDAAVHGRRARLRGAARRGNGAVFKLVPQFFPHSIATVTGLVGAIGGLGGFFPPLLLGFFRDRIGVVWPGFGCWR